ncbi:MAG TPA: hypothetical protein VIJ97_09150, partial [Candidatus Anoxymicrobiaceae bacterium]
SYGELTFFEVDGDRWPALGLAYEAARRGGTCPAAMNAANEEAVAAFLERRIGFTRISEVVGETVERHERLQGASLDEIREAEARARSLARELIEKTEKRTW